MNNIFSHGFKSTYQGCFTKEVFYHRWFYLTYSIYPSRSTYRSSPPEMFLEKVFGKYAANLHDNTHAKCDFNEVAKQLLSCKFAAYFQNTFS